MSLTDHQTRSEQDMMQDFLNSRDLMQGPTQADFNQVTSPKHYTAGGLEVIDILRKKLSPEEFRGFCKGNVLKYVLRADHKNGVEDLKKAQVYLGWLIEC